MYDISAVVIYDVIYVRNLSGNSGMSGNLGKRAMFIHKVQIQETADTKKGEKRQTVRIRSERFAWSEGGRTDE